MADFSFLTSLAQVEVDFNLGEMAGWALLIFGGVAAAMTMSGDSDDPSKSDEEEKGQDAPGPRKAPFSWPQPADEVEKDSNPEKENPASISPNSTPPAVVQHWIKHRREVCSPISEKVLIQSLEEQWTDFETVQKLRTPPKND